MTKDMTNESPLKLIAFFSIPILLGNIFQQFYSMADTMIVGRYLGEDALAAVGSTGSIIFLVLGFNMGIAQGFGILISHAFGAQDQARLKHYVAVSILLGCFVSAVMTAVTVTNSEKLLQLMKTPENILPMANSYIIIIYAGMAASMFFNIAAAILRGVGDSRTPLYFLLLSSALNILLDIIFIRFIHMGPAGAAWATILSQGVSAVLCFIYMFRRFDILQLKRNDFRPDIKTMQKLLKVGIPMAINYSVTAVGIMILQSGINVFGSTVVASYTAASKVEQLATQPMPALGATMATYCGQNLGAGKCERILDGMKKALLISIIISIFSAFICIAFGEYIVGWFLNEPTAAVLSYATTYLRTISCFFLPLAMIFLYRNAMQGLGNGIVPLISGMLELAGRSLIILFLLERYGYIIICLASPAAWIAAGILLTGSYFLWQRKARAGIK